MSKRIDTYTAVDNAQSAELLGVDSGGLTKLFNVTTSATDETVGRVMKVGDFGLGQSGVVPIVSDLDAITASGIYLFQFTATGKPSSQTGNVFHMTRNGSAAAFQIAITQVEDRSFYRVLHSSVWSSWYEYISTKDYPSDTAWTSTTTLLNDWTGTVNYIKRAGMVTVVVDVNGTSGTASTIFTLPSGYIPGVTILGDGRGTANAFITTSGGIGATVGTAVTQFTFTYPVI